MEELAKLAGKDVIDIMAFVTAGQEGNIGDYRVEKGESGIHIWKGDEHVTIPLDWGKDWRSGVRNTAVLEIDGEKHYFINTHHFTDEEWRKMWKFPYTYSPDITDETVALMSTSSKYFIKPEINVSLVQRLFPQASQEVIDALHGKENITLMCDGRMYDIQITEHGVRLISGDVVYNICHGVIIGTSKCLKMELGWKSPDPNTVYFPDRVEHWSLRSDTLFKDETPVQIWSFYIANVVGRNIHDKEDGPSVVYNSGREEWWSGGVLHRIDGPAITDGEEVRYYIRGVDVSDDILEMFGCLPLTCPDEQKVAMTLKWG